jgi:mRNA-degrading endonuclease toxin of MazEF toxin-antitoxin module
MTPLGRGRVVRVNVFDPQGRNRKRRPAVVISTAEEIDASGEVIVVCVSRQYDQAPPEVQVELPHDQRGVCRSGLREPSWAVATWVTTVKVGEVEEILGAIPAAKTNTILGIIAGLDTT